MAYPGRKLGPFNRPTKSLHVLRASGFAPDMFSPLTDWRDLGPLIERYEVQLHPPMVDDSWYAAIAPLKAQHDNDLKRAACLALFYAQKGESDE